MKIAINNTKKYLIKNIDQDYHSTDGQIAKEDLQKDRATSKKGVEFSIFDATFLDMYEKIKRQAQIITLKDLGTMITETGIGKNSVIVEAGSGSGASGCLFAHIAKKVYSYDIREDHSKVAQKNAEYLGLTNITFAVQDIREDAPKVKADVVLLDMPDPWNALDTAAKILKPGGHLVIYSPTIPQVMDTAEAVENREDFIFLKMVENIQRPWEIKGRKVRPLSSYINHTAFLSFVRRV